MDRKAMYKLSYGLFILTAKEAEKDNGCIINTAIQAASEPNQLSICVNKANYTHDMIQRTGKFTVSVLSQKAQFELFKHFGFQSGRDTNKFEAFPTLFFPFCAVTTAAKSNNKIGKKVLAMLCIFVRYNLLVYIILKV